MARPNASQSKRSNREPANNSVYGYNAPFREDSQEVNDDWGNGDHNELKWVLYLTLVFCLIEIIVIYGKDDFLNVCLSILILVDRCELSPSHLFSEPFR